MRFGRLPLTEAEGAILAHGLRAGRLVMKKGRRLGPEELEALAAAGIGEVVAAKLEPGDVGEDEAATRIGAALLGENVVPSAAFTGRVNLFAGCRGLLVLDAGRLDELNRVDEAITVATLPAFAPVEERQMVATVKIIPFAAPAASVERVRAKAAGGDPLLRVLPFVPMRVVLLQTRLPGTKDSVLDKTVEVTRGRLAALGSSLVRDLRCGHDEEEVASLLRQAVSEMPDLVLLIGASAVTDRRDVLPAGIERAGGAVEHFGMPVDPGNLLLLARCSDIPVLGLPGCARSPKVNGFDWVLQRVAAGLRVTRADVMGMGVGGLLAEIPTRPLPRTSGDLAGGVGDAAAVEPPRAPRIAALVLAAGRSTRMGSNKLLADIGGTPMVARVVDNALASHAARVTVVTGHQHEEVIAALAGRPVEFVHNPRYAEGLGTSLAAGIAALPDGTDGVLVCLGDMPGVSADAMNRLIAAHAPAEGRLICVPMAGGRRGNPVLWDRRFFPEMRAAAGDVGARTLFDRHAEHVCEVQFGDDGVLTDIDTPDMLAALRATAG